ncbi:acylneuraminate cytidylyltransferase family protein [Aureispira sp. CCB-QB1]|uniref:acylneuraminate cytidylyltransferase family protein n=1 Tax=Aureispira sp. CCB-QB1 TaxID=1313421 RepID=UPI00069724CD|nr:acylneuraminate cytidylyltransferase family protein [Aureispira sp. CCB-QB1]
MNNAKILYLIPARGGSKGVPNKNIKHLGGKPLIYYSITEALKIAKKEDICVSTDSIPIKQVVESIGVEVPFLRPDEIASDTATTESVILHALDFYKSRGINYEFVVLLQPTSPLRKAIHIKEAIKLIDEDTNLIVSVKETDSNPYYVLFQENEEGILEKSKKGVFTRRQDCPTVYELNGAIYIIRVSALLELGYQNLKMIKYLMPKNVSIDIDDEIDFEIAEILLNR